MRNQYKVLAEKYNLIQEGIEEKYRSEAVELYNMFKDKPGFRYFAEWLLYQNSWFTDQEYKNLDNNWDYEDAMCDYLEDNLENHVQNIADYHYDNSNDVDMVDIAEEAWDRAVQDLNEMYDKFIKNKKSLSYKRWEAYKAAAKALQKQNKSVGINLDL